MGNDIGCGKFFIIIITKTIQMIFDYLFIDRRKLFYYRIKFWFHGCPNKGSRVRWVLGSRVKMSWHASCRGTAHRARVGMGIMLRVDGYNASCRRARCLVPLQLGKSICKFKTFITDFSSNPQILLFRQSLSDSGLILHFPAPYNTVLLFSEKKIKNPRRG